MTEPGPITMDPGLVQEQMRTNPLSLGLEAIKAGVTGFSLGS